MNGFFHNVKIMRSKKKKRVQNTDDNSINDSGNNAHPMQNAKMFMKKCSNKLDQMSQEIGQEIKQIHKELSTGPRPNGINISGRKIPEKSNTNSTDTANNNNGNGDNNDKPVPINGDDVIIREIKDHAKSITNVFRKINIHNKVDARIDNTLSNGDESRPMKKATAPAAVLLGGKIQLWKENLSENLKKGKESLHPEVLGDKVQTIKENMTKKIKEGKEAMHVEVLEEKVHTISQTISETLKMGKESFNTELSSASETSKRRMALLKNMGPSVVNQRNTNMLSPARGELLQHLKDKMKIPHSPSSSSTKINESSDDNKELFNSVTIDFLQDDSYAIDGNKDDKVEDKNDDNSIDTKDKDEQNNNEKKPIVVVI